MAGRLSITLKICQRRGKNVWLNQQDKKGAAIEKLRELFAEV
jgi:hypothetical protein